MNKTVINFKLLAAESIVTFAVIALALFLSAGTFRWVAGWCFLILFFGFFVVMSLWLYKHDPGLLQERMTGLGKQNQVLWDKVFMILISIIFIAWLILMQLDAVRFQWSHMPAWLQACGAIILVVSFYLFYLVYRENPYLSPAVRIQNERGQKVISSGLYHFIRHPFYAAFIPFFIGVALLLGSRYGILFGLLFVILIGIRATKEEKLLLKELQGYESYMAKVKYRFIPYIW